MKILSAKKLEKINTCTSQMHAIATKKEISNEDYNFILANVDSIRSICGLQYIRRELFIPMPKIAPPKKEECKHVFEIGFYENSTPFLFCKHCAKIIDLPIGKRKESE